MESELSLRGSNPSFGGQIRDKEHLLWTTIWEGLGSLCAFLIEICYNEPECRNPCLELTEIKT